MKWVKKSQTKTEIAYAVKKVIGNSCDKIVKSVEKAAYEKMWNGCKGAKK